MSEEYYVGLDLGTVNSCLAYSDHSGNVSVSVSNNGIALMPSYIIFTKYGKLVGAEAMENCDEYTSPDSISSFKRMMGTDCIRTFKNVSYNPSELFGLVVTKLLQQYNVGTGQMAKSAVITVPGDYGEAEKNATEGAGRIAGLERVEIINESVAAAISYRHDTGETADSNIIVYDLGGGTLDVTVIKISGNTFTVLSDESSKDLGGKDWDLQMASIIQKKVLDSCGLTCTDVVSDNEFRKNVMIEAERQKLALDTKDRSVSTVRFRDEDIRYTVDRREFEDKTEWLMAKTIEMIGYALRNSGLNMKDIDKIVLVGGASKMSQVQRSIEEAFPSKDVVLHDPELAIAKGAALYAKSIFGDKKIKITAVTTRTLGIVGGIDGKEMICNVVYRNSPLPMECTIMCRPKRDDQEILDIRLYESLSKKNEPYIDLVDGKPVFRTSIELPGKIARGKTKIPVKFDIDSRGRITITLNCNGKTIDCGYSEVSETTVDSINESRVKMGGIL